MKYRVIITLLASMYLVSVAQESQETKQSEMASALIAAQAYLILANVMEAQGRMARKHLPRPKDAHSGRSTAAERAERERSHKMDIAQKIDEALEQSRKLALKAIMLAEQAR